MGAVGAQVRLEAQEADMQTEEGAGVQARRRGPSRHIQGERGGDTQSVRRGSARLRSVWGWRRESGGRCSNPGKGEEWPAVGLGR